MPTGSNSSMQIKGALPLILLEFSAPFLGNCSKIINHHNSRQMDMQALLQPPIWLRFLVELDKLNRSNPLNRFSKSWHSSRGSGNEQMNTAYFGAASNWINLELAYSDSGLSR